MKVVVEGTDLPGTRCKPPASGDGYANVHVGLCTRSAKSAGPAIVPSRPWHVVDLVPGDAPGARWEFDIVVREDENGQDFGGPFVRGNRGDRHIGLAWGELPGDGTFRLFRGAKLRLEAIDPTIVRAANQPGARLVARLGLTDAKGNPRCASVRPPTIAWSAE
jgi:Family of unknown function (DUF5990)